MSKPNLSDNQPKDLNAEAAEFGAKVAEESLLCVTLRNPLRPLRLIPSLLTGPRVLTQPLFSAGATRMKANEPFSIRTCDHAIEPQAPVG